MVYEGKGAWWRRAPCEVSSGMGLMLTSMRTSSMEAVPLKAMQRPTPCTSHTPHCSGELSPSEFTAPLHRRTCAAVRMLEVCMPLAVPLDVYTTVGLNVMREDSTR